MNYTTCQGAFAGGFHNESAGNNMAFSDHARDDIVLTPWENMKRTVWLLTKWTLEASGLFKADSMFLIEKCACAVVKDIAFHLEGELASSFGGMSWHNPVYGLSVCGIFMRLEDLEGKPICCCAEELQC